MNRSIHSISIYGTVIKCGMILLLIFCPCLISAQDGCLSISWTAPGDDDSAGKAAIYEIRYFTEPITEDNWELAWEAPHPPVPKRAGTTEQYLLMVAERDVDYFFAIRAADEVLNWSPISNIIQRQPLKDTCIGVVGNVDCDPEQLVNISDITMLVSYLFNLNSTRCICTKESDIDFSSDGEVNVADLTYLLRYLFFGTEELTSCID